MRYIVSGDRSILEIILRGLYPFYDEMEHPAVKKLGSFMGGFVEKWSWNSSFNNATDQDLIKAIKVCSKGKITITY